MGAVVGIAVIEVVFVGARFTGAALIEEVFVGVVVGGVLGVTAGGERAVDGRAAGVEVVIEGVLAVDAVAGALPAGVLPVGVLPTDAA